MKTISPLEHGKFYHIYNRGINSDTLFKENNNYDYFLSLYDFHISPIVETYAWCLMKNHFHFLVRIKEVEEIAVEKKILPSQSFSNLFNAYTKAFNKSYNRHGALFERPFRRKEINFDKYFQNMIVYIHNNPVKHNICDHPLAYPWSSYITCLSEKPKRLLRKEVIELFDDIENFKYSHQLNNRDTSFETYLDI
jgi:REP element-mobilizing transposase RayT